jgi:hypothetical protein
MKARIVFGAALVAAVAATASALALSCASGRPASVVVSTSAPGAGAEAEAVMVRGEFEDASLFAKALAERPEMVSWSAKEICDGLSGATLQNKDFGGKLPDRTVLLNGKVLAYSDGFGQYWIALPPGTYALVGKCRGYRDARAELIVAPGSEPYVNFFLERR